MKRHLSLYLLVSSLIFSLLFAISSLPQTALAGASIVQTAKGNGGGYVNTYTLALSSVTAGDTLVASLTAGSGDIPILTDNNTNTWIPIATSTNAGQRENVLFYVYNAHAGATTVTVTFQSGQYADSNLIVREYSGLTATNPLDKSATGNDYGASLQTHVSSSTAVTTQASELLIVGCGAANTGDPTWAAGTGYGNLTTQGGFDNYTWGAMEDQTISSTGTQIGSCSTTAYTTGEVVIGTFKLAATALTLGTPKFVITSGVIIKSLTIIQ